MTAAPLRFVFNPQGEELAAAKRCEADVFLSAYGNTAEEFDLAYGAYEEQTGFMTVLQEDGEAAATLRFIADGPAGLKTLNDISGPPWNVDGLRSARAAGIDPARTWDIATIAVRRGAGRGGLCAGALYYGIVNGAAANNINFIVMILDSHLRKMLSSLGLHGLTLPGTKTAEYMGSPSSTPLWSHLNRELEQQRQESPDAYRLIFQAVGLDGVAMPTDWTLRPESATATQAPPVTP